MASARPRLPRPRLPRSPIRDSLRARRQQEALDIAARLLAEPEQNLDADLKRLETYDKLIAACPEPPHRDTAIGGLLVLASLLVAGLLWSIHIPESRVLLDVEVEAVGLTLSKPWARSEPLRVGSTLRVDDIIHLDTFLFELPSLAAGGAWLDMTAERMTLSRLRMEPGAYLEIQALNESESRLTLSTGSTSLDLEVGGTTNVKAGSSPDKYEVELAQPLEVPDSIELRTAGRSASPIIFRVPTQGAWTLRGLDVSELRLARQVSLGPGEWTFESSIKSGTLSLPDVAEDLKLREGENLDLRAMRGRITQLRVDRSIHLAFEGTADSVLVGPTEFQRNAAPSVLKYLYHQQPLSFFWSTVTVLSGMLWSIRKAFEK